MVAGTLPTLSVSLELLGTHEDPSNPSQMERQSVKCWHFTWSWEVIHRVSEPFTEERSGGCKVERVSSRSQRE